MDAWPMRNHPPASTDFRFRPICEEVGFDYVATLLAIRNVMSYDAIAEVIGYRSKGGISALLRGAIPSHVQGEALWALHVELFGTRPPLKRQPSDPGQVQE